MRKALLAIVIVLAVAGTKVSDLAGFFRKVWSLGKAGVEVPLMIYRDGRTFEVRVASGDRNRFLKVVIEAGGRPCGWAVCLATATKVSNPVMGRPIWMLSSAARASSSPRS